MQHLRIAPTPSGFLHLGNAFNFILTALLAHSTRASLRLRIDDADATRARPEFLDDIFETIHWLGIRWNDGPRDAAAHAQHFSQSHRAARYAETIGALAATGAVFACGCSRKDILAASPGGQYPGTCRAKGILLDTPDTALRLRTQEDATVHFDDALLGPQTLHPGTIVRDPVIRRRDGIAAYHIASLTDDVDYGVTHIVRGEDLLSSTAAQLFISRALGGTPFARVQFYHHPLLTDKGGEKLSKSAGSASLRGMRSGGAAASEVYRRFSSWMGWPKEADDFSGAAQIFATQGLEGLKSSASLRSSAE